MFSVAFFGLFRIGELTFAFRDQQHTLQLQNVSYDSAQQGYVLTLNTYNFSNGKPASVLLKCHIDVQVCSVCALRAYLYKQGVREGPLFCHPTGRPIYRQKFSTRLNQMLKFLGLSRSEYQAHSFRIGATYAAQMGMSDAQIRQLGRWKSNAFKKYIRF